MIDQDKGLGTFLIQGILRKIFISGLAVKPQGNHLDGPRSFTLVLNIVEGISTINKVTDNGNL